MHVNRTGDECRPRARKRNGVPHPDHPGVEDRALLRACPCPALILSRDGTLADCNEPFLRLTGFRGENRSALPIDVILDRESRDTLRTPDGDPAPFRGMYRTAGGELLPAEISRCPLPSGETALFLVPVGNNPAAVAGSGRNARLEIIGMAAAGISHHLNTLHTVILGNITLGTMDAPPSILPTLRLAERATLRAASFTGRLLELARGTERAPAPMDPEPIIDEVAGFLRSIIDPRVTVTVAKQQPLGLVFADSVSLHHALLTLAMNAWEALGEAGRAPRAARRQNITIEAKRIGPGDDSGSERDDRVTISVSDTGAGLSGEVRAHLFEPFFTTKGARGGTGIGLATARDMIERNGGRIDAFDAPGAGSTFTISLPAASSGENIMIEQQSNELPRGTETILLMDDDELVRGFGKAILERLGYTVLLASDGDEGLDLYLREQHRIDLVIIDMIMPALSGDEVLRRILASGASPRVVLTTGFDRESACGQIADLGEIPLLLKPFTLRSLTDSVRSALDGGICAG